MPRSEQFPDEIWSLLELRAEARGSCCMTRSEKASLRGHGTQDVAVKGPREGLAQGA